MAKKKAVVAKAKQAEDYVHVNFSFIDIGSPDFNSLMEVLSANFPRLRNVNISHQKATEYDY